MQRELACRAFRLAIALGTDDRITLAELLVKSCKTTCDYCGKHAPFIDLYTLYRRCLDVGGKCTFQGKDPSIPWVLAPWLYRGTFGCVAPFLSVKNNGADVSIIRFHCRHSGFIDCQMRTLDPRNMRAHPERTEHLTKVYSQGQFREHLDKAIEVSARACLSASSASTSCVILMVVNIGVLNGILV